MNWRPLFPLVALLHVGCWEMPGEDEPCQHEWQRPLEDGERVNGHDPIELLAPYGGHWRGAVTWRDGETTGIDVDMSSDPLSPVTAYMFCDRVGQVFTRRSGTISTDDGALGASTTLLAIVRFPIDGTFARDTPDLSFLTGPVGLPASAIVDAGNYSDSGVRLDVTWTTEPRPSTARILFIGTPKGTAMTDTVELGKVTF